VAEYLGDGQVGLGDGDVPHSDRASSYALGRPREISCSSLLHLWLCMTKRCSISPRWSVMGVPWPVRMTSSSVSRVSSIDSR